MAKSVAFNANLASTALGGRAPLGARSAWMSPRRRDERARAMAERVGLRPPSVSLPVGAFSGGNQQKVVLGRWIMGNLRVLILDEPTRGIDVGARSQIHRMIRELADAGMGVLIISSDFEELLGCNRVLVMTQGRITAELVGSGITEEAMLRCSYGDGADKPNDPSEGVA